MKSILNQYHKRINVLEGEKYDLEYEVAKKDMEVEIKFSRGKQKSATLRLTPIPITIFFCLFSFFFLSRSLSSLSTREAHLAVSSDCSDFCILIKAIRNNVIRRRRVEAEYSPIAAAP